ncbi:MAG: hypothetical protein SGI71_02385 [Verrucomicrobiota bacterium]|nr:hypothetical protein [Verrucomicrobiota bacterium]
MTGMQFSKLLSSFDLAVLIALGYVGWHLLKRMRDSGGHHPSMTLFYLHWFRLLLVFSIILNVCLFLLTPCKTAILNIGINLVLVFSLRTQVD